MDENQVKVIEERFNSFLSQLRAESDILDRIVYKNKNQHRRSSYFQYLLKVRRDLKLFHSVNIEELLDSCFIVITGRKPVRKAHLLESFKRRKCDGGNYNIMDRLQGVARLLSEMVEPILKAATDISTLLARSFFMGFSVMVLALLARLRVLVQQLLLDVVSVYNELSSLSQKKQSIKITQDGIEVFREYHPIMEKEIVMLECVWKMDKFVLLETKGNLSHQDVSSEPIQNLGKCTQYQSIDTFLGDDELDSANNVDEGEDSLSNAKRKRSQSPLPFSDINNHVEQVQSPLLPQDGSKYALETSKSTLVEESSLYNKPTCLTNKKVAFVSIKTNIVSTSCFPSPFLGGDTKGKGKGNEDEDNSLYSVLSKEEIGNNIF